MTVDLIGFNEMVAALGVSRATAARHTRRDDFPPALLLADRRLWVRAQVERWAENTLPLQVGRPPKEGR